MTTKRKAPPAVSTSTPLRASGLFSGDGKDPELTLPRPIPVGTGSLGWPAFSWAVLTYDGGTKRAAGLVGACALVVAAACAFMVPLTAAPLVIVLAGLLAYGLAYKVCKGQAVCPAQVLRRDENGAAYLDRCELWVHEESDFPDLWRWEFQGRRILVLDTTDGARAWPFDPWLAPLPAGKGSPSPTDLEQAAFEARAIEEILRVESGMGETIKAAFVLALAGAGVAAFYMAAQQAVDILGFGK